jgi:large subunit ribosomal protein L17
MRHNVKGRKLGRTTEHRQAMFKNQLASLIEAGRIKTTLSKAKELRPIAEKVVTKGKRGSVEARRQVSRWIPQRTLIKKLFDEVAPRFQTRNGGYLRILKLGPRPGDGAEMAILQWVDYQLEGTKKKPARGEKGGKPTRGRGKEAEEGGAEGEEQAPAKKAKGGPKAGGKPAGGKAPGKPAKRAGAKPAPSSARKRAPRKAGES